MPRSPLPPAQSIRLICAALLLAKALFSAAAPHEMPPLMPLPARINMASGQLRVDASFRAAFDGYHDPLLDRAVSRFFGQLEKQTGMRFANELKPSERVALMLSCAHAGKTIQAVGDDEAYQLSVSPDGARISAAEPLGILRGLETFLQLVQPGTDGFDVPALTMEDEPRFPWRGLSYDVARHFMPVDEVKRTLDGMAAVKLNVFHLHLSDNQGFRVESRVFPRLHTAGSSGQYYRQSEVREIVAYAHDRGIRVVPEFDIPGHATAILVAYPELAAEPAPVELDHLFGIFDPVMDPSKPAVYLFLDKMIGEMASLFPDAYFHIGGDENNGKLWRESLSVQKFKADQGLVGNAKDPDVNLAFHAYFNRRMHAILQKHGKRMEGWDEILSPDLPTNIVIQSWRGQNSLAEAVRLGYQGILSAGYYLDLVQPAAELYAVDPLIDPVTKQDLPLTAEQQKRILGGEAAMWSEWVTPETVDSRIWPRAAVIAERLWSPESARDIPDMYRRLAFVSRQLEWVGLTHRSWEHLMLQRLAGTHDPAPLQTFAEMIEPVKGYDREGFGPYTTITPLNHLVDAIPPESETAERFNGVVDRAIAERGAWDPVRLQLTVWRANQPSLQAIFAGNELLNGVESVATNAFEMAGIGMEALDALSSGRARGPEWKQQQSARVRILMAPQAAVQPAFSNAILRLIAAVL